jgi:tetratricopeptide (TPR) repeat protein
VKRSRSQIDSLIQSVAKTPPDWWDSVPLNYPKTLDLTGTYESKKWEPQKKVGAHFWSIITPNPGRWRGGIRLLHHILTVRKQDRPRLAQAMHMLANSYRNYEKDWARAAFWYRKAIGINKAIRQLPPAQGVVGLAECYYRLGSQSMAAGELASYRLDIYPIEGAIKLWAEMGQTRRALSLANAMARQVPARAYVCAGNIYRRMGKYAEAVSAFETSSTRPWTCRASPTARTAARPRATGGR